MAFLRNINRFRNTVVVILAPILLLPLPLVVGSKEAKCAYILFIMGIYWVTEALPIAVTSLLPIILTPLVGLGSAKTVSSHYLNDTSMLFTGGLIIAVAIEHWNIHKRLALKVLLLVGTETRWLMLGLMLPTWLLSMWISNTATSAMMVPIANAILIQLKSSNKTATEPQDVIEMKDTKEVQINGVDFPEKSQGKDVKESLPFHVHICTFEKIGGFLKCMNHFMPEFYLKSHVTTTESDEEKDDEEYNRVCKMLSICIAQSATCGGVGSLTGTGPNVIFKGQSDLIFAKYGGESPVTFSTWFSFGLPISAVMFVISWLWLQLFFLRRKCMMCCSGDAESRKRVKTMLKQQYKDLGPVNFAQAAVIGHFILLAVLWITIDLTDDVGWKNFFPNKTVTNSTPAILLSCSLFIFPSKLRKYGDKGHIPPLLTWKTVEKRLPWGVIILLGGGFALAFISQEYGLSKWLGTQLAVFDYLEPWVMNMVLCIIVAAATEVTSNVAMTTLLMPILAELSLQLEVNPLYFMFPATIATSFAFMLPVATPPNAVVFSYGYIKVIDMVKVGFIMNILGIAVLVLATETLGNAVFGFHTLPDVFKHNFNTSLVNSTCDCLNSSFSLGS